MIYTVTINPAIDCIMTIDNFKLGVVNRANRQNVYAGGKGLNVSTMLTTLGVENVALGFVAGFTGLEIESQLQARGCRTDFIHLTEGMSRINIKLITDKESEINGNGPNICVDQLNLLLQKLDELEQPQMIILSGSVPYSLNDKAYVTIIKHQRQVKKLEKIVVDAPGNLLLNTLPYHPFLIKPNKQEMEELFSTRITEQNEIISCAAKLQKMGAENVLVSLGADGAVLLTENGHVFRTEVPLLKQSIRNTVGAGDSMIAGFVTGYLRNYDYEEALNYGVAAGSATAVSDELGTRETTEKIYKEIYCRSK